jgi:hypothetical protein
LLIGFEASTLRRFTLRRRGWRNAGVVAGDRLDDAERRFFEVWVRDATARRAAPPALPPSQPFSAPDGGSVVGLFPEPGAQR